MHWRPAELIDALRARTKEPRIVRNEDGVEVVKSRIGEEQVSKAFDDVEFHLARMDRQGVNTSVLSLVGCCWIQSQPVEVSLRCAGWSTTHCRGFARKTRGASVRLPRCRSWKCLLAAAEFERALGLPGVVGAQVPGNGFLTKKDAENMRPLLGGGEPPPCNRVHSPRSAPSAIRFPVSGDTDNARRRKRTLDMQASLSSVMVTLCLTPYLAPFSDAMVLVHNLGGNIPYEIERMDHRSLLDYGD